MVLWRLKGVSAGDREKIKNKSLNKEENGGDNDQLKQSDEQEYNSLMAASGRLIGKGNHNDEAEVCVTWRMACLLPHACSR